MEYRIRECGLPQECILVLVSDGILELMPESELLERYNKLLLYRHDMNLDPDKLAGDLGVMAGRRLPDDIAFLVMSRCRGNG